MKISYLLNGFPHLSETFILNEITGLIDLGHDINIISRNKPTAKKMHDKVKEYDLVNKTKYLEFDSDDGRKKYSRLEIFEKGAKELFESRLLTKEEKFKLLDLCYEKERGKEIAFRKFLDILSIIRFIKEKKIEHIHCHFALENTYLVYVINQILGIPFTFTTHAWDIFVSPNKNLKKWAENAKKVIAVSEFNKKHMNEKLGILLDKIKIINYVIHLDKLKPIKNHRTEPFKIISISRLVEKKGYLYLIKACKILKDKGIAFSCEIQGDGQQREELINLIKYNNLEKDVKLGSALTHEEVLEFMETGSVFVLPCILAKNGDMDGIPNVLMESMAKQIPTISTRLVGIPELIDNNVNGVLVEPENASALADAIIKIKNDKEFTEKIRKKGREKIINKFDIKKNILKLVRVFEE